jgi:hydrogenase maturation protein HypF
VAIAALVLAGEERLTDRLPIADNVAPGLLGQVRRLAGEPNWPRASGAGRVFEAGGALLGLVTRNDWEGEAAARLEALAAGCADRVEAWPEVKLARDGVPNLPSANLLGSAARRLADGEQPTRVALGFHTTFNRLAIELTLDVADGWRGPIALGGGCMVNRLLLNGLVDGLEREGFEVLVPRRLPPGDGGLSYGQAVLGAASLARGVRPELVVEC